jgi:probable rRNA maturation factor
MRTERGIAVDVAASRGFGTHRARVQRLARAVLSLACDPPVELSVALVGDEEMRELNASYRSKDRTTDVLAFSQREGEHAVPDTPLLGDVVISIPVATRQAGERGTPVERELAELLVHGILHLLGYDHERSPADARRMFARTRELMAGLEERGSLGAAPSARSARRSSVARRAGQPTRAGRRTGR